MITDFAAGAGADHDIIEFSAALFTNYAAVQAAMSQVGDHVVITSGSDSITINNLAASSLIADDFNFV